MKRSSFLEYLCLWLLGISRREMRSGRFLEDRARLPRLVSIIHPRISLIVSQYSSLANAFFRLAESLTSTGKEGEISLRAQMMISETLYFWLGSPWEAQRRSSI